MMIFSSQLTSNNIKYKTSIEFIKRFYEKHSSKNIIIRSLYKVLQKLQYNS